MRPVDSQQSRIIVIASEAKQSLGDEIATSLRSSQ